MEPEELQKLSKKLLKDQTDYNISNLKNIRRIETEGNRLRLERIKIAKETAIIYLIDFVKLFIIIALISSFGTALYLIFLADKSFDGVILIGVTLVFSFIALALCIGKLESFEFSRTGIKAKMKTSNK